jgi:hypothetical protein
MNDTYFTKNQVLNLKEKDFPLLTLVFNYRSLISTGITMKTAGAYNHFMWAHRPGHFASQDWFFNEVKAEKYLKNHRMKFWTNKTWTERQKRILQIRIRAEIVNPRWKTRYDLLAIFGQLIGITGIQVPWTKICSDHADYLKLIDSRYDLVHPSPEDVNTWLKGYSDYEVFGRFVND